MTIFLFIAVLILLFKTFKSTIIALSVIPLGMVGALIALWITGNSLSFVSLIALAGIEVKTSILLVDFTNQLRKEGIDLNTAIQKSGETRFLPIVLTSITAWRINSNCSQYQSTDITFSNRAYCRSNQFQNPIQDRYSGAI